MFFPDKDSLFLQILYIFAKQWHMLRFNHTTENMKTKTVLRQIWWYFFYCE